MTPPTDTIPAEALAHPLADADPNSITALFDADPDTLDEAAFDRLVAEFRQRADAFAADEAAKAAAPKAPKAKAKPTADPKIQALRDNPDQLSLDDLI